MATTPKPLKVYTIPVDGSDPKLEVLQTIEAPILEVTNPDELTPRNQTRLHELREAAKRTHLVYDLPEGAQKRIHQGVYEGRYRPNVRLLPDVRTRWRSEGWDGWEKRAAIVVREYPVRGEHHVFYSHGKGGPLGLNKHANEQVSGEMFILKVSDTRDESGRRFYVDFNANPNIDEEEDLDNMFSRLFHLEYNGTQRKDPCILAYSLPQDGTAPHTRLIGTTPTASIRPPDPPPHQSPSDRAIFGKMVGKGFHTHVNFWGHDETIQMRILPDIQPGYGQAQCATVGDNKYHMLLNLAKPGKEWSGLERNPHISEFPLWDDVRILKVSEDLDSHNNWFYEDIEEDFELPQKMLSLYTTQLAKIWQDLGGEEG